MAICRRCKGEGTIAQYRHIKGGVCYLCQGTGHTGSRRKPDAHGPQGTWAIFILRNEPPFDRLWGGGLSREQAHDAVRGELAQQDVLVKNGQGQEWIRTGGAWS